MPVRSLRSRVLKWPDARAVDAAVRGWATEIAQQHPNVVRIGYFGSYARGNWGVGSDVDLVAIVSESEQPFERRAAGWDTTTLPVSADLLVYTSAEWSARLEQPGGQRIAGETVWVYPS